MKARSLDLWLFLSAALIVTFFGDSRTAWAAPTPTTTTLTLTSGSVSGTSSSSIASGTVVTLTATVTGGGHPLTTGLVSFCDATVSYCADIHLLGTAQLTSTGTAVLKIIPGLGSHSYRAVFSGTTSNPSSSSETESLTVTGPYPTTTTIAQSGTVGNYTLTGTVVGVGSQTVAPTGLVSFVDTTNANHVLATGTTGSATSGLGFLTASNQTTASSVNSIVFGDFNGDGKLDVAYETFGSSVVNVLLGKGDGTFTTVASPQLPDYLGDVLATADFNGDGKTDLLIESQADPRSSNVATVLLGNGDGTFTAAAGTSLDGGFIAAAGDFDQDGIPDVVTPSPCAVGTCFSVLLGNGDGTFRTGPTSVDPLYASSFLVSADFNGDGIPDLYMPSASTGSTSVYLGNGDGTFTRSTTLQTNNASGVSLAADFNGDGKEDLAITTFPTQVLIFLGNGDGTFKAAPSLDFSAIATPTSVATGDFDGDGKADLAVSVGSTVALYLGNGDGTFTPSTNTTQSGPASQLYSGDFNDDGKTDLVVLQGLVQGSTSTAVPMDVLLTQLTQTVTVTANNISTGGVGIHAVLASYAGDSTYSSSVSATTGLSAIIPTTLTLSASPASGNIADQQVTLTATLSPYTANGQSSNGETVTFSNGSSSIGTAMLSNGIATLNSTSLPIGTDALQASYGGDAALGASTSNSISYTVAPVPTLAVAPGSPSLTVTSAGSVTDALALTPSAGYTGTVSFKCSNLPQNATCTFQPTTVTFTGNNNTAAVSLTIQTGVSAQAGLVPYLPDFNRTGAVLAAMLWMPGLFVAKFTRRRRSSEERRNSFLLMFTLFGLCTVLTACSGGSSTPPPSSVKTPSGTYTAQVIATGTNGLSQNTAINLTVQ